MPKERGKATIVLLCGTSTAGKSTICKELVKQGSEQTKPLHWDHYGVDLAMNDPELKDLFEEINKMADKHFIAAISSNALNIEHLKRVQEKLDDRSIIIGIMRKEIELGDQKINLTPQADIDKQVDDIFSSLKVENREKYSKDFIRSILQLVRNNQDLDKDHPFKPPEENHLETNMFDRAIENSRKGIPTILDIVPMGGNFVDKFEKHLAKRNFSCPIIVALAHCSIGELTDRMDERNRLARLSKVEGGREDPRDVREGFFPYMQYVEIFEASSAKGARVVGSVRREDITRAAEKFGTAPEPGDMPIRPKGEKEALELMKKLGFPEDAESTKLVAKYYHDKIYNTEARESTREIAADLCRIATTESYVPAEPHPVAQLIRRFWEDRSLATTLRPAMSLSEVFFRVPDTLREQIKQVFVANSESLRSGDLHSTIRGVIQLYIHYHPDKHDGVKQPGYDELCDIIEKLRSPDGSSAQAEILQILDKPSPKRGQP
ncbi:MAG: hypothetical protein KBD25_02335 [Rickettsiaceae bacterium]|nr:hypothetical protein [Rickettsiaceae bacterium]